MEAGNILGPGLLLFTVYTIYARIGFFPFPAAPQQIDTRVKAKNVRVEVANRVN